ncbi:MAG: threonine synthase [Geminicoccaceae bacterium]|nr:threonine synthase [Geminicoccaceae bacterium]
MSYVSTRGEGGRRSFEEVLLAGLAEDGGLFVPESWPSLDPAAFDGLDYAQTTARILAPFTEGCFDEATLLEMARAAYAGFADPAVAPLRQIDHDAWVMELFHGPTLAFKDFALQLLGRMFERVLACSGRTITIVGATSGDTGSAAIHATAGRAGMRICILHPQGRVSEVQRRQMTTVDDANVLNIAVAGTFDDCQDLVKAMFADTAFRRTHRLAAVNSINWARLAAQAAYYAFAAVRLKGPLAFAVPTGNFGDVYAGYIAQRMGLPIEKLIVATNRNDILARFFADGRYAAGTVHPTISPSMDIQVASNFERLLFDVHDRDGAATAAIMRAFARDRQLSVPSARLDELRDLFAARRVDEQETAHTIAGLAHEAGYVVDPHTAVGIAAARAAAPRDRPVVTLSTAHSAKFPDAVEAACGIRPELPARMSDLLQRPERSTACAAELSAIQRTIENWPV